MGCPRAEICSASGRFALNASTDGHGDGSCPVAGPRGNDGAKATRWTARGNNEEIVGRLQGRIDLVAAVAHHRALAHVGPFRAAHTRALVDEVGDVALGPAGRLNVIA